VLRKIFWSNRATGTVERKRPYNEKLNDLYCSPNIIRENKSGRIRRAGHVACMGGGQVVGRRDGKTPLGRH